MIDKKLLLDFSKKYSLFNFSGENYYFKNKKKFYFKKKNCEICKSAKNNFIFQRVGKINFNKDFYGYLPISICLRCGLKFLSPRPNNSFYRSFFKLDYGKTFHGNKKKFNKKKLQSQYARGKNFFKFFNKLIKSRNKKMLDHGCATGVTSLVWKKNGWDVSGIDPHLPSIEYGKKEYGLDLKCCYGEKIDFKSNSFGIVISLGSLEHCYDVTKNLKEIHRVLVDSGCIIIRFRKEKITGSPIEYFNSVTLRYFKKKNLTFLLKKNGFKNIRFIDKPVEGYETFSYVVAKKKKFRTKNIKIPNEKNNILLNDLKRIFLAYYLRCLEIKKRKLDIKNVNLKKKLSFINKNKIALMNIGKKKSIERYFDETKKFLLFLRRNID